LTHLAILSIEKPNNRTFMKNLLILITSLFLIACGGGGSDSGGMAEDTIPGTNVPVSFVGTYTGTATITASALGITETDTFPITITVTNDAMVRFDGDEPDETFTVGLGNDGEFSGTLPINEDPCSGTASVDGSVDGTNASGTVSGSGTCQIDGLTVDVELDGTFEASL